MVNENSFLKLKLHSSSSNLSVFTSSGDVSEYQPLKLHLGVGSYVESRGWGKREWKSEKCLKERMKEREEIKNRGEYLPPS